MDLTQKSKVSVTPYRQSLFQACVDQGGVPAIWQETKIVLLPNLVKIDHSHIHFDRFHF